MSVARIWLVGTALLVLLAGCGTELPQDEAGAVLKDLAVTLATMEKASAEEKMAEVRGICAKHSVELNALAAYLKATPQAERDLALYMKEALAKELAAKKADIDKKIKEIEEEADKSVRERKQALEEKLKALRQARDAEVDKLAADFNRRKTELEQAIAQAGAPSK
jgi:DNA anti-recombination protein RmuC